jgi:hypothetical protein
MKFSRKMRLQVEVKIRHGLSTGSLPEVERPAASTSHTRHIPAKASGSETDSTK